jgi:hypothetical protein
MQRIVPLSVALAVLLAAGTAHADLIHRYSFDGTADDSVGTANGTLVNHATISGGNLVLTNNGASGGSVQYLSLPAGVIPTAGGRVTVEEWFSSPGMGQWGRGFDFGTDATNNFFFTPHSGFGDSRVRITLGGNGNEMGTAGAGLLDNNVTHMIAAVLDQTGSSISYYIDGTLSQSATLKPGTLIGLGTTSNYLGRSQYNADPGFVGTIDEFRIYDTARTASQIATDFGLGPNRVSAVPEPTGWMMLATGSAGAAIAAWRRRRYGPSQVGSRLACSTR